MQWFKFGVELIPSDIRDRFRTAHILNPNILIQRHFRKLYNVGAGMLPSAHRVRSIDENFRKPIHWGSESVCVGRGNAAKSAGATLSPARGNQWVFFIFLVILLSHIAVKVPLNENLKRFSKT